MATNNQYLINNVEALWPRINKTYKFDNAENRTVPCDAFDEGAKYETRFRMTKDQAKALFVEMVTAYESKKEKGWPDKFDMPFKKEEDGSYSHKASLKGAYGKDATFKPVQYDSKGVKLPDDFMLTTGSTVNVAVTFTPYNMREAGVSLRLRAVQVIKYVPMEAASPFGAVEGGFQFSAEDNPFEVVAPAAPAAPAEVVTDDLFGDDTPAKVEEPKKVVKKTAPAPKASDDALASIVADWDD
tara:strand:+ start:404 stop:1129 length:726 start_codon:yes stop_codon:yes gene_type:complete